MSLVKSRDTLRMGLSIVWLLFTIAFAIWWFKFSMEHISALAELQPERADHWGKQKRMVFWEGTTWIVLLALGGGALIGLVQTEKRRARRIREFFASFSHEVKTSLASLRVQAEALKDDWSGPPSPILDRLVGDTVRLNLQLENSLFLASQDSLRLYLEPMEIEPLVERLREQWPNLKIRTEGRSVVRADERALRTVFSNLAQNAMVHGKATTVEIKSSDVGADRVRIVIRDDGRGFDGDPEVLGELFHRPKATSGSGLGLYICRLLVERMDGRMELGPAGKGFEVRFELGAPA
ncbi:MAG TPA: HAMP domain-containing sensor histidine kinase [Bdellovibrionales bacterium]|nr:HAMP domain-containing sensor histidine kinase [Bdellovibrionales bacterium]